MTLPRLALIAAVASNGVIGRDGALPWRLPADLRRFRALTTGHSVIMGRRTWESLGRALPERQNIVVSRHPRELKPDGAVVAGSLAEALAAVALPGPAFCIGGALLYAAALPLADLAYITEIARAFDGDAVFPPLDRAEWREVEREHHRGDSTASFEYDDVTYRRRGST